MLAYGVDQPFCCGELEPILASGTIQKYFVLRGRGRKCSICLNPPIYTDEEGGSDYCSLPLWVLDMIDVESGNSVELSAQNVMLYSLDEIAATQLLFKSFWSYQHWDESTCAPEDFLTWQNKWPPGVLTPRALLKMMPSLLHSRVLVHESLVAVDVLDICLLFEVRLILRPTVNGAVLGGEEAHSSLLPAVQIECKKAAAFANIFDISIDGDNQLQRDIMHQTPSEDGQSDSLKAQRSDGVDIVDDLQFLRHAHKRIITACQATIFPQKPKCKSSSCWNGVRSILVSGSEGAGKSSLLKRISNEIHALSKAQHTESSVENSPGVVQVDIFQLSAKDSEIKTVNEYENMSSTSIDDVYSIAARLISVLGGGGRPQTTAVSPLSQKLSEKHASVILIDDIDAILVAMKEDATDDDGKGIGGTASSGTADIAAAYYLRLLLKALACSSNSNNQQLQQQQQEENHAQGLVPVAPQKESIFVIGATRISATSLPRSQIGAPEFENIVALPRPSPQDRAVILRKLLLLSDYKLDTAPPHEVRDDDSKTTTCSQQSPPTLMQRQQQQLQISLDGHIQADSNLTNWTSRAAGMTSGYLPGDLKKAVEKLIEEHRTLCSRRRCHGPVEDEDGNSTRRSVDDEDASKDIEQAEAAAPAVVVVDPRNVPIKWTTMLSALAASPPLLLRQLEGLLNGSTVVSATSGVTVGGGGMQQRPLCWSDFAGYEEVKTLLKRLIKVARWGSAQSAKQTEIGGVKIPPSSSDAVPASSNNDNNNNSSSSSSSSKKPSLQLSSEMARGIVLHGPTGCGKTFLAKVVAAEANMNFVPVRSTDLLSPYFGQTEAAIRNLFIQARAAAPCLLFFDEFDALAYKRGTDADDSPAGLNTRILSTFLNEMDGVVAQSKGDEDCILVLAACASLDVLDDALLRPGRLQHHIELKRPSSSDIEAILRKKAESGGLRLADEIDFSDISEVLVQRCEDLGASPSGAHIEKVCGAAVTAAVHEAIGAPDKYPEYQRKHIPSDKDLFPEEYERKQRMWVEEVRRAKDEGLPPLIIADEPLVPPEMPGEPLPKYLIDRIYRRHFMKAINKVFPFPHSASSPSSSSENSSVLRSREQAQADFGGAVNHSLNSNKEGEEDEEQPNTRLAGETEAGIARGEGKEKEIEPDGKSSAISSSFTWSGSFATGLNIHN